MKNKNSIPRREFLELTALGIAGASLGLAGCASDPVAVRKKPGVGVQLYSVRDQCRQDFPAALTAVSKTGFRAVEFAGYWNRSAPEIRKMLDDNGLIACGSHTPYEAVRPDKLQATIEFNQTLGNKFIIVPDMSEKTKEAWITRCDEFNGIAAQLQPLGMSVGYHSHFHDFHPVDGEFPWDIFGEHTHPEIILQLDTGNCCDGGADPLTELKKFPGRTRSMHVKPHGAGPDAVIGEDKIDWPAIFDFCESQGGIQWYVIEHETAHDPVDALRRSYAAMKTFGKV